MGHPRSHLDPDQGQAFGTNERTDRLRHDQLRTLVQELGIGLLVISHLRRPDGDRGHEAGQVVRPISCVVA